MSGCTTCHHSVTDSACIFETNCVVFINRILLRPDMIDSEITTQSCSRSLDGETLKLQDGGRPCDVAQSYTSSGISRNATSVQVLQCKLCYDWFLIMSLA